jgi:Domain of unknown function (DUF4157)
MEKQFLQQQQTTIPKPGMFIQPKLTINQPNDVYEQEADAIADKVMRMEQPGVQLKPLPIAAVQRKCEHCEEEEKKVQRKEINGEEKTAGGNLENYVGGLSGGGQSLTNEVRNFYEPRFGYDFSNVKVHNDSVAAKSAQSINALAYTSGNNVVFNEGQYSPNTESGKWLLGHELTHVVQQKAAGQNITPAIQRAMKFEFQTRNYVWRTKGKSGKGPEPLPRKYSPEKGVTDENGTHDIFLHKGVKGDPAIEKGQLIEPHGRTDQGKPAEFLRTYKVIKDPHGTVDYFGEKVTVKLLERKKKNPEAKKGGFNRDNYELKYYDESNKELFVHLTTTGERFIYNWPFSPNQLTENKVRKEGTAVELQSEHLGFIEFETPKWFRKWCELKAEILEAKKMTEKISDPANLIADTEPINRKIRGISRRSGSTLYKWPSTFDMKHFKHLRKGEGLVVEVVKPDWEAYIQPSEDIAISQYESLLKEHEKNTRISSATLKGAEKIFNDIVAKEAVKEKAGYLKRAYIKASLSNLRSFLQMVANYIMRGQVNDKKVLVSDNPASKFYFNVMLRTSFYSVYHKLLNKKEQDLFKEAVESDVLTAELGPYLNEMLKKLSEDNSDRYGEYSEKQLTGKTNFFLLGHGGGKGPTIKAWLKSIYDDSYRDPNDKKRITDKLSPVSSGSASSGKFDVNTELGYKDTNLIKFEMRVSGAHGGNVQPANKWADYAEEVFQYANTNRRRKNQKDDITTPDVDETTKTDLEYKGGTC